MPEERRCIAIGRGPSERPHFYLGDVDQKGVKALLITLAPEALIVETKRGFHVISNSSITNPKLLALADPKCPGNAVRIYPHDDLVLIQRPWRLCVQVAKIYESIFKLPVLPIVGYDECHDAMKFGIYMAEKEGIKLHGDERTKATRDAQEKAELQ